MARIPKEKRYFVRDDGAETGPYPWFKLRAKLRTKQLTADTRIREEDGDRWFPLAELAAERAPEDDARAKTEVDDAIADARRRGKKHLAIGVGCLGVGIVLTIASFGFFLFWGLILIGLVELGRGINLMRA
jgi:hypothetical protein